jgi:hypothetical protein
MEILQTLDTDRRDDTCRITGMNSGQLDMFHYGRYESIRTVCNCIGFSLNRIVQESINKDRPPGRDLDRGLKIEFERFLIMHHLHTTAA